MRNSIKIAAVIVVPFITICIVLSDKGSAELDEVIRNAIMVAYMNGYADALRLNMDEINKLKTNQKFFRQTIEKAAAEYIITVENMNK